MSSPRDNQLLFWDIAFQAFPSQTHTHTHAHYNMACYFFFETWISIDNIVYITSW